MPLRNEEELDFGDEHGISDVLPDRSVQRAESQATENLMNMTQTGDAASNLLVPNSIQVAKPGEAYLRSTAHFNRSKPTVNSLDSSKRSSLQLYDSEALRKQMLAVNAAYPRRH